MESYAGNSAVWINQIPIAQNGDKIRYGTWGETWKHEADREAYLNRVKPLRFDYTSEGGAPFFQSASPYGSISTTEAAGGYVAVTGCSVGDKIWAMMSCSAKRVGPGVDGNQNRRFNAWLDAIDNFGVSPIQTHIPGTHWNTYEQLQSEAQQNINGFPFDRENADEVFNLVLQGVWTVASAGMTRITFAFQFANSGTGGIGTGAIFQIVGAFSLQAQWMSKDIVRASQVQLFCSPVLDNVTMTATGGAVNEHDMVASITLANVTTTATAQLSRLATASITLASVTTTATAQLNRLLTVSKTLADTTTTATAIHNDFPAQLQDTLWHRASYAGSPWAGVASQGSSSTNSSTEATTPPVTGTAQNGWTPADFNGTTQFLTANGTLASYGNASTITILCGWCLFIADFAATDAGAGSRNNNPQFFADANAAFGMGFSSAGIHVFAFTGGDGQFERTLTCGTGAYHLLQFTFEYNTSNDALRLRLDSGSWSASANFAGSVGINGSSGACYIGKNWNSTKFFDGRILDMGLVSASVSDAQFDLVKSYCNSRYSLSL